jgi:hypothetical protein
MRTTKRSTYATATRIFSLLLAVSTRHPGRGSISNIATAIRAVSASATSTSTTSYKTLQVHVIHRHGDRTPITPLQNVDYWRQQLVPESTLTRVARHTNVIRDQPFVHSASGGNNADSPFGKLTQLGLLQMIQVGTTLRQALLQEGEDEPGDCLFYTPLFCRSRHNNDNDNHNDENQQINVDDKLLLPVLHPSRVRIYSTDFQRTIQSVQGLLVGLFPDVDDDMSAVTKMDTSDGNHHVMMDIDVRHTACMIPDPQPRLTQEQHDLELALSHRPHMRQREINMSTLAHKATKALHTVLDLNRAHEVSFGVDSSNAATRTATVSSNHNKMESDGDDDEEESVVQVEEDSIEVEPLAWNQLAEITKCLQVRDLLPSTGLTLEDQQAISEHAAWRWMETLSHPRLTYLATNQLVQLQIQSMLLAAACNDTSLQQSESSRMTPTPPPLTIWSAHDSTLLGLLCAYRLERPPVWPEYASYLVLELVQVTNKCKSNIQTDTLPSSPPPEQQDDNDNEKEQSYLAVRFSLNGQRLRSDWSQDLPSLITKNDEDGDEPAASLPGDLIPLHVLAERTRTIGATPLSYDTTTAEIMFS